MTDGSNISTDTDCLRTIYPCITADSRALRVFRIIIRTGNVLSNDASFRSGTNNHITTRAVRMSFRPHDNCTRSICIMILGHRTRSLTTDDNISIFCCICYITNGNGACRIRIACSFLSPCMSALTYSNTVFRVYIGMGLTSYYDRLSTCRIC